MFNVVFLYNFVRNGSFCDYFWILWQEIVILSKLLWLLLRFCKIYWRIFVKLRKFSQNSEYFSKTEEIFPKLSVQNCKNQDLRNFYLFDRSKNRWKKPCFILHGGSALNWDSARGRTENDKFSIILSTDPQSRTTWHTLTLGFYC